MKEHYIENLKSTILKNYKQKLILQLCLLAIVFTTIQGTCKYSLKDVSIPPDIKTVRVFYIENKARYVNPQLSPKLSDKLRQKIVNQTRLSQTNNDADFEISGYISDYSVNTSGISGRSASSNNLNVSVHIIFKNKKDEKKNFEADITRNFPFSASKSLTQAEGELNDQIISSLTDEIFNRIFSNW